MKKAGVNPRAPRDCALDTWNATWDSTSSSLSTTSPRQGFLGAVEYSMPVAAVEHGWAQLPGHALESEEAPTPETEPLLITLPLR